MGRIVKIRRKKKIKKNEEDKTFLFVSMDDADYAITLVCALKGDKE